MSGSRVRSGRKRPDDDGFSLVEILVSLGIMSVVGAVFTTGILQVYRTSAAAEADSLTQTQLSVALLRLDRSVRYAYSIGAVHLEATQPYVEYLMVTPETTSTYVKRCVQLRLFGTDADNLQLQSRSWVASTPGTATSWTVLASNLTAVTGAATFARSQPTAALNHQLLTVRLGARANAATKTSAVTFTAMNTYASTALDADGKPLAATAEPCYQTALRS